MSLLDEFCKLNQQKGMLCSCSYCRKVRDSQGTWQPFEQFMMRYSTLNFSHGICNSCMEEHFPDVAAQQEQVV
jgi:hypothetical protein